jgi:hypothetical protein
MLGRPSVARLSGGLLLMDTYVTNSPVLSTPAAIALDAVVP